MPLTISEVSVSEFLKQKTDAAHRRTESLLLPMLTSLSDKKEYAALLRMFYGFYYPLEQLISRHITPSILEDINTRRNSALVLADLSTLGMNDGTPALCHSMPLIDSAPAALGALYVLEGSTLGGRMITKMLLKNEALGLTENELRFFAGYKQETGPRWTAFLKVLNQWDHETETIASSAEASFNCLSEWIGQNHSK